MDHVCGRLSASLASVVSTRARETRGRGDHTCNSAGVFLKVLVEGGRLAGWLVFVVSAG